MRRYTYPLILLLVFLAACTAGPNVLVDTVDVNGDIAGFWMGLWHGFISPFAFIASWFTDVEVFEVHNNGGWYVFGFLMGASCIFGSSGGGAHRTWRSRG